MDAIIHYLWHDKTEGLKNSEVVKSIVFNISFFAVDVVNEKKKVYK